MHGVSAVLDAVRDLEVLVVGDALLDEYLDADAMSVCREGPAPSVHVARHRRSPGGAANVAANRAALGARVHLVSAVGDDADAAQLREALSDHGVPVTGLTVDRTRRTPVERRIVLGGQLLMRLDDGGDSVLFPAGVQQVCGALRRLYGRCHAVVVSDYGRGAVPDAVVAQVGRLQQRCPTLLVVDAHDVRRYSHLGATAIKPNHDELQPLLSGAGRQRGDRAEVVAAEADALLDLLGTRILAATLDVDGAVVCERGRAPYRTWSRPTTESRACGAGDAYLAAFTLTLAAGAPSPLAAELAQCAALVVTGRDGTGVCTADELRLEATGGDALTPADELVRLLAAHRRRGRRIVFTNGCFDLLHRGHVDLLQRARRLGDVLVVGLNSDASVRSLKGPGRPVNSLEDRARVLAALGCIDHLTPFDGRDAAELVELLQPDVYVKGGDYTAEMLPEAPHVQAYGGEVRILPYVENRSTSSLIERIRS
jgi:D-beta-D-heptose 7-phosphate kinase/D-beta-D-heptose 1-phosphate adenosyltransferase